LKHDKIHIASLLTYSLCLLLLALALRFDLIAWHLHNGYNAFQQGDINSALIAWEAVGDRPEALYNRAVAHARSGESEKAARLFAQAAAGDASTIRQRALYNHGTLLLQQGKAVLPADAEKARQAFASAETQLQGALKLDPRDSDATHNRVVAHDSLVQVNALIAAKRGEKKRLPEKGAAEQAKKEVQKGKQTEKPGKAGAETDSGEAKGKTRATPGMTKGDAERLLNDARGREALRSATAARTKQGVEMPKPEKDW
jgi:hypothetical protein